MRIIVEALGALQEAGEQVITTLVKMNNQCAIYMKRIAMMDREIGLVHRLINIWDPKAGFQKLPCHFD